MVSVEDDDLAGLEDVSSEDEDENYEAESTDGEAALPGIQTGRRPYRKRPRVDSAEPLPLMEGEGRSFRVLGFNQNQRAAFVQILMRFGVGDFDWREFTPRLKQKTYEEIKEYGRLFLTHIAEEITDLPNFSDGVPKEGLRIQDVLVRIAQLMLVKEKVQSASENVGAPLFAEDIVSRFPSLKPGKFWKDEHDLLLLRAVLKHGYGRWQAIVDDKDLRVQEVICQELNLPFINVPIPGQVPVQPQNVANSTDTTSSNSQPQGNGNGNDPAVNVSQRVTETATQGQVYQDSNLLHHYRDMQRKQVEFIKKRVLLLEKGLNTEYQQEYFGELESNENASEAPESEPRVADAPLPSSDNVDMKIIEQLPQINVIAAEEISTAACDDDSDRMELARMYNKMCKVVEDNVHESVQTFYSDSPASHRLRKNLIPLENAFESITRILTPESGDPPKSEDPVVSPGQQSKAESSKTTASFTKENGRASAAVADTEMQEANADYTSTRESRLAYLIKEFVRDDYVPSDDAAATKTADVPGIERVSLAGNKEDDVEMKEQNIPDEAENPEPNGAGGNSESVILLDD